MNKYYLYTGTKEYSNINELELNNLIREHLLNEYNVLDNDNDTFICDTIDDAPICYFGKL